MIESIRAKIAGNPLLSVLASAAASYAAVKYGPAIQSACSYFVK